MMDDDPNAVETFEASASIGKLVIWIILGSLTMLFGALAVMYLSRHGDRLNYPFDPPTTLWLSTALLLASSFTFRSVVSAARRDDSAALQRAMGVTLALGLAFVASQVVSWYQLSQTGLFGSNNPFRNLFYVLTGVHAFHVLLGIGWVAWCRSRAKLGAFRDGKHEFVEYCAMYWHFMDATWLVLFALLMFL